MQMANGFDSAGQYEVSTWRGIEYGTRKFKDGEVVTVADIPATTLYTFYRFHMVKALRPSDVRPSAVRTPTPAASGARPVAASSVEPQPRNEGGVLTLPRPPRDRKWLATATIEELRKECEERHLDTSGDKGQLRSRLHPLVG